MQLICIWRRSNIRHRTQCNGLYEICLDSSQESGGGCIRAKKYNGLFEICLDSLKESGGDAFERRSGKA